VFVAFFIVACGGSTHSPSEIPSLEGTGMAQPADKEVGVAGPGSGGGDGGGGPLGGRDWPEPGEDAGPLELQDPEDDGQPHSIGPWGPVIATYEVEVEPGETTIVKRLSSSDPFTATYQLEDGTIVVSNEDLSEIFTMPVEEPDPPSLDWVGPDSITYSIFEGEILVYFVDSATQQDIEQFIVDHNLHVIMSWFEPPDEGLLGNALAWFHFEYDPNEFPTFDDAFNFFAAHELIESVWPAFTYCLESWYTGENFPNDYYYYVPGPGPHRQNAYINVLGIDESPRVPLGRSQGNASSRQYIVVIDDGVYRPHPEFRVWQGTYIGWRKITWVGVNVYRKSYRVGYHYGEPNLIDPSTGLPVTHGTGAAGMLTATTDDWRGVAACAPQHIVLPIRLKCKFAGSEELHMPDTEVKAVRALRFQFAHNQWIGQFRVVSMSIGGERPWYWWGYPSNRFNLKKNINRDLWRNDRLYVAAAGNDYSTVRNYPAAFDNVLGVSGLFTNRSGGLWYHRYYLANWASNYRTDGYRTYPVSGVCDFTERYAYGWWVGRSLSIGHWPWQHNDWWYQHFNGTSAATPEVAGLAAILYHKRPWTNYSVVMSRIVDTRDDSKARGYVAGLVDYDAALTGW